MSIVGPKRTTPSSKTPPVPYTAEDRRFENINPANPINIIAGYKETIAKLDRQIKELANLIEGNPLNVAITLAVGAITQSFGYLTGPQIKSKLENLRKQKAVAELRLRTYKSSIEPPKKSGNKDSSKNNAANPPKAAPSTEDKGNGGKKDKPVIYNANAVKFAYFDSTQSLFNSQADANGYSRGEVQIDSNIYSGNTPASAVKDALELWKNSSSGKGMIQTWFPNGKPPSIQSSQPWGSMGSSKKVQRYGFQFQYNPGNISMTYSGVADTDIGMLTSGIEEYLSVNPNNQSTISFNILINRMFDMQYLGPGGKIKGSIPVTSLYSGNIPTANDLKKIYNRGTMYDVEFLLQSMFAFSPISTQFRNKTWDIGFLGGHPVELHLGNKLRYAVKIDNINVDHVIFDHRMVPLFTNVSISARRIPDFKPGVLKDISQTNSTTTQSESGGPPKAPPGAWQAE